MAEQCDCAHLPGCGGPVYKWMLEEWKNCFRCENHLRLQSEYLQYFKDFMAQYIKSPNDWAGIGRWCAESPQEMEFEEWCERNGDKQSLWQREFEYWRNTVSEYKIHQIRGDTPFVTMTGDFSMDDLMNILEEMRQGYEEEREKWEAARDVPFSIFAGDISNDLLRKDETP